MGRGTAAVVGTAAFITCALASTGQAAAFDGVDVVAAEERLLGSIDEAACNQDLLSYKRELAASGVITGSLVDSLVAAGVPASTSLDALRALGTQIDLERDVKTGERFHVRHEESFTLAGDRIGVGRVLWLEVVTKAKGTIAIHRFQPKGGIEQFWLASGKTASPPMLRQPLEAMKVTSGFGLRADPLDHPASGTMPSVVAVVTPPKPAAQDVETLPEMREAKRAYAAFDSMAFGASRNTGPHNAGLDQIMSGRLEHAVQARAAAARRLHALQEEERKREEAAALRPAPPLPPKIEELQPEKPRQLFMHEGLDLLANTGTPVYAAGDGVVMGLGPNGGYGNFIKLVHGDKLTTVYGHLSGFAPGLQAGQPVARGELIGFVGSTGRSTGAHLHFEIQSSGRPVNPVSAPSMQGDQLAGTDLVAFKKQVAASLAERQRESRL